MRLYERCGHRDISPRGARLFLARALDTNVLSVQNIHASGTYACRVDFLGQLFVGSNVGDAEEFLEEFMSFLKVFVTYERSRSYGTSEERRNAQFGFLFQFGASAIPFLGVSEAKAND